VTTNGRATNGQATAGRYLSLPGETYLGFCRRLGLDPDPSDLGPGLAQLRRAGLMSDEEFAALVRALVGKDKGGGNGT
jgi:hypothetical protein